MTSFESVCEAFDQQAHYCDAHGSPLTARLLRGLRQAIQDHDSALQPVAAWSGEAIADALPLRVAGALHALVLDGNAAELARCYAAPESDEALLQAAALAALRAHPQHLGDYLATPPQTNEVGRSAVLLGGFTTIAAYTGLPLRLLELGASAGLNGNWDRYGYRLGETMLGDVDSGFVLAPLWHGNPPPCLPVSIAERAGCDRAPIDIADAAQRRRLRSYVWADQVMRLQQLDGALAIAERYPIRVEAAEADEWIEQRLASRRDGVATVVYHTIFWSYLASTAKARIETALHKAGEAADAIAPLAWLRFEIDDFRQHPRLLLSLWPGPKDVHLADAQAHGREIFWHA